MGRRCANNLRQLAQACHSAHDRHKRLPPAFGFFPGSNIYSGGCSLGTLYFHLLPDIEQQGLFNKARYRPRSAPQQDFFLYTANGVHREPVPLFNCPSDSTNWIVNRKTEYAQSSYAANYLVFGVVDSQYVHVKAQGRATFTSSFQDGTGNTILFAEKYALSSIKAADSASGRAWSGGCHWAYFQADCNSPFFAYHFPGKTDPGSVGPIDENDNRDSRFQVQTHPEYTNPCRLSTTHPTMNAAMADGSVRQLAGGMDRYAWWALVTPRGGEINK